MSVPGRNRRSKFRLTLAAVRLFSPITTCFRRRFQKMYRFLILGRAISAALIGFSLVAAAVAQTVSVTTQHYDTNRTGANLNESILTTSNVSGGQFGKLF